MAMSPDDVRRDDGHHLLLVPPHLLQLYEKAHEQKRKYGRMAMNVRQAQTLVNDNDELNEPQDGQHSDTIGPPEICFSTFVYYIYRPFQILPCY
jgi:hypothetical protein